MKRKLNIVFMGTPEFAIPSLDILLKNDYNIQAVVTAPDKPAGRGKKLKMPAVKQYAVANGLRVLQPKNLKDESFQSVLKSFNANLFVIVAFRMLPGSVWNMPHYGSFNLHASLLPQFRGAAPMNWAIINGEKETGLTTFFLNEHIDTGDIILQKRIGIKDKMTVGELHDVMMRAGAELVLETVKIIESDNLNVKKQHIFPDEKERIKPAPKIYKEDCRIVWDNKSANIINLIRGLSPYPGAYTKIELPGKKLMQVKIFDADRFFDENIVRPGILDTDNKSFIKISSADGWVSLLELQLEGKKRMNVKDFLRGFDLSKEWIVK